MCIYNFFHAKEKGVLFTWFKQQIHWPCQKQNPKCELCSSCFQCVMFADSMFFVDARDQRMQSMGKLHTVKTHTYTYIYIYIINRSLCVFFEKGMNVFLRVAKAL